MKFFAQPEYQTQRKTGVLAICSTLIKGVYPWIMLACHRHSCAQACRAHHLANKNQDSLYFMEAIMLFLEDDMKCPICSLLRPGTFSCKTEFKH